MYYYPVIIFFRYDKYNYIDNFLIEFQEKHNCTFIITSTNKDLINLFSSNFHLLITFGENKNEYMNDVIQILPERILESWIHFIELPNFETLNEIVNTLYIKNVIKKRIYTRPIFSIFTSSFNSFHRIIRAYKSIKNQTFIDWEWVIIDDSNNHEHFLFLKKNINDPRVRLYQKHKSDHNIYNIGNIGNIGNAKNEVVSLCRGQYLLELDHDDEIIPELLENAFNVFKKNKEIGFIYMDFMNIYENDENFYYPDDIICKGYGGYYMQKYQNKWRYVYITPNINNITLSALVCCPNHPRIWKKDLLINILENYSEYLYICDDYELLLKTALYTKIAKIHKCGYIQYVNDNNNNFSFICNSEINRIGPTYIYPIFYDHYDVHNCMKLKDAYENEEFIYNNSNIWKRPNYEHKICNLIINIDYKKQYCIIGIDSFYINQCYIKELYKNTTNDFILLDNKQPNNILINHIEKCGLERIKCMSLLKDNITELKRFFELMYKSCDDYEFIMNKNHEININFFDRHEIINYYCSNNDKYLEIGIEYGYTFNNIICNYKIGIDPDPKINDVSIKKIKSDDFFQINTELFDIIFIDGMHQVTFVINDINNSIQSLNKNGKLFIDDIIPYTYEEQLSIPINCYYENNILKYRSSWTGDVWKVIYHILKNYNENINFKYFFNSNYRGVFLMTLIKKFKIHESEYNIINNYHYIHDFKNYIYLLENNKKYLSYYLHLP